MKKLIIKNIKALLFDLGGVVIDIDINLLIADWSEMSGMDTETLKSRVSFDSSYEQFERGEITVSQYFKTIRKSLQINLTDEQLLKGWNSIFKGEIPGAKKMLQKAKQHFPLYAFSNSNTAHQQVWEKMFADLLGNFNKVFVSSDIRMRKPEHKAYNYVAEKMKISPENILFFDDLPENIEGARSLGMHTVLVNDFSDIKKALTVSCSVN